MSRIFVDGYVHVRKTMCATCIFRPGNLMQLNEGRVDDMIADSGDDGAIPCHQHIHQRAPIEPVCRGFYDQARNTILRVATIANVIRFVDPEDPE